MANSRGFLKRRQESGNGNVHADAGEVARVAYQLYEQRGRAHGHDLDDWLKAEAIVARRNTRLAPFII